MDGWNTSLLLGWPIFRGYVSFRECRCFESPKGAWIILNHYLEKGWGERNTIHCLFKSSPKIVVRFFLDAILPYHSPYHPLSVQWLPLCENITHIYLRCRKAISWYVFAGLILHPCFCWHRSLWSSCKNGDLHFGHLQKHCVSTTFQLWKLSVWRSPEIKDDEGIIGTVKPFWKSGNYFHTKISSL